MEGMAEKEKGKEEGAGQDTRRGTAVGRVVQNMQRWIPNARRETVQSPRPRQTPSAGEVRRRGRAREKRGIPVTSVRCQPLPLSCAVCLGRDDDENRRGEEGRDFVVGIEILKGKASDSLSRGRVGWDVIRAAGQPGTTTTREEGRGREEGRE